MKISEFLNSKRGKNIMGYVYGWGAAVVMVGALFKLQHWPYAGYFLTIGLLTEAVIFFLSAFEKPYEQTDWSRVYPELRTDYDGELPVASSRVHTQGSTLEELISNSELSPELLERVGRGLTDLGNTAQNLSEISSATVATNQYVQNIEHATTSIGTLTENSSKANEVISSSVNKLAESYQNASKLNNEAAETIHNNLTSVSNSSKEYSESLQALNQHISTIGQGLHAQIQNTEEHFKSLHNYTDDMRKMSEILSQSTNELAKYKQNAEQLNRNLEELNSIYGNMLNAMKSSK